MAARSSVRSVALTVGGFAAGLIFSHYSSTSIQLSPERPPALKTAVSISEASCPSPPPAAVCTPCPPPPASPPPAPVAASCAPAAAPSSESLVDTQARLKEFFAKEVDVEKYNLGHTDAEHIMPYLRAYYHSSNNPVDTSGSLWDIGANLGTTSATMIDFFTPLACREFEAKIQVFGPHDPCDSYSGAIFSFEPVPATFKVLSRRAKEFNWAAISYYPNNVAMTDVMPESGTVAFFGSTEEGNQQGGLDAYAAGNTSFTYVTAATIDTFRKGNNLLNDRIFLLKVDVEGFDAHVLSGGRETFLARAVKFVVAEYNWKWQTIAGKPSPWSLQKVAENMKSVGYECYLMAPSHFVPLWEGWWDSRYEFWYWSNFICFQTCDPDGLRLLRVYNRVQAVPRPECDAPGAWTPAP